MTITIIRHGKVKHIWKKNCTSAEFDEECRLYDAASIEEMKCVEEYNAQSVYISGLDRSYQTARMMLGDRAFSRTDKINEVPLRSSFDTSMRLPLWIWNFSGRLQWFCNSKRQLETRRQTIDRADQFVQELIAKSEDCIIVTHGFFMHTLISVMRSHGFRTTDTRMHYQNGEAIVLENED